MISLAARLAETSALVETALSSCLKNQWAPPRLAEAMRHAALNGGKRIRPFLVLETARLFGIADEKAIDTAVALECVHCYSLVHDDLPSMDDDALRRGKPTLHIAYDEATAILAGDSLLTLAFEILSRMPLDADIRLQLICELSIASGAAGMAGGQMLDLAAEGRFGEKPQFDEKTIGELQARKTGALIRYAVRAGGLVGGATEAHLQMLTVYGDKLGLLFQLADDLIDATGDATVEGKSVAKDTARGKATLVSLLGVDEARKKLNGIVSECENLLVKIPSAENLRTLPLYLAERALGFPRTLEKTGL